MLFRPALLPPVLFIFNNVNTCNTISCLCVRACVRVAPPLVRHVAWGEAARAGWDCSVSALLCGFTPPPPHPLHHHHQTQTHRCCTSPHGKHAVHAPVSDVRSRSGALIRYTSPGLGGVCYCQATPEDKRSSCRTLGGCLRGETSPFTALNRSVSCQCGLMF